MKGKRSIRSIIQRGKIPGESKVIETGGKTVLITARNRRRLMILLMHCLLKPP